jgi:hypothetical protein
MPRGFALFSSLGSGAGIYKIEGDGSLSINWDASWSQWWTGRTQKRKVEIEGNKMTITSAPTKSVATGREIIFIITLSLHSKELNNTTGTAHCTLAMRIACKEQWGRV